MDFLTQTFRPHRGRTSSIEDGIVDSKTEASSPRPLQRQFTVHDTEKLKTFRLMVGIQPKHPSTARSLSSVLTFDGRSAPNVGIYNRVAKREKDARRGYFMSALLINGCLGIQVAVAAALTAMGAANSNNKAITAFGAINTIIAGLLTYLKGSGLPNRLRYFEDEWKRVREFIEQRERDFSLPDCMWDVPTVVNSIEAMYEEAKTNVQTNTPDNYVAVGNMRNRRNRSNSTTTGSELTLEEEKNQWIKKASDVQKNVKKDIEEVKHGMEIGFSKAMEFSKALDHGIDTQRSKTVDAVKSLGKDIEVHERSVESSLNEELDMREKDLTQVVKEVEAFAQQRLAELTGAVRDLKSTGISISINKPKSDGDK